MIQKLKDVWTHKLILLFEDGSKCNHKIPLLRSLGSQTTDNFPECGPCHAIQMSVSIQLPGPFPGLSFSHLQPLRSSILMFSLQVLVNFHHGNSFEILQTVQAKQLLQYFLLLFLFWCFPNYLLLMLTFISNGGMGFRQFLFSWTWAAFTQHRHRTYLCQDQGIFRISVIISSLKYGFLRSMSHHFQKWWSCL